MEAVQWKTLQETYHGFLVLYFTYNRVIFFVFCSVAVIPFDDRIGCRLFLVSGI